MKAKNFLHQCGEGVSTARLIVSGEHAEKRAKEFVEQSGGIILKAELVNEVAPTKLIFCGQGFVVVTRYPKYKIVAVGNRFAELRNDN